MLKAIGYVALTFTMFFVGLSVGGDVLTSVAKK